MTELGQVGRYQGLVNGAEVVESRLGEGLAEYLCAEVRYIYGLVLEMRMRMKNVGLDRQRTKNRIESTFLVPSFIDFFSSKSQVVLGTVQSVQTAESWIEGESDESGCSF